jgi:hypothetical protein
VGLEYYNLVSVGIATEDEQCRQWWQNQNVTFFLRQENFGCPDFDVAAPRINVLARVYDDNEKAHYIPFRVCYCIFNNRK